MTGNNPWPGPLCIRGPLGMLSELEAYDQERKVWRGFRQDVAPMWLGTEEGAMAMDRPLISK